jgi:hypothetical protein
MCRFKGANFLNSGQKLIRQGVIRDGLWRDFCHQELFASVTLSEIEVDEPGQWVISAPVAHDAPSVLALEQVIDIEISSNKVERLVSWIDPSHNRPF